MTHFSTAGEGLELTSPDARITVKAGAEHTGGAYELFEVDAPRGPAVPPHTTPWPKAYYVLHGRMTVLVDDAEYELGPAASITVPPDAPHTFTVRSPSVQFLAFSLTDAMGRFFRDVDRSIPAGTALDDAVPALVEVVGRHGIELRGTP
ncbi:cupin domain-containing protein [Amycolatopsis sacchari]|uniref:cupin domain-containing protein n=1 Tax=Amycolatopsis sacchari TaxID=115433 RepID=UPI003EBD8B2A